MTIRTPLSAASLNADSRAAQASADGTRLRRIRALMLMTRTPLPTSQRMDSAIEAVWYFGPVPAEFLRSSEPAICFMKSVRGAAGWAFDPFLLHLDEGVLDHAQQGGEDAAAGRQADISAPGPPWAAMRPASSHSMGNGAGQLDMEASGSKETRQDAPLEEGIEEVEAHVDDADQDVRAALGQLPGFGDFKLLEKSFLASRRERRFGRLRRGGRGGALGLGRRLGGVLWNRADHEKNGPRGRFRIEEPG